MNRTERAHVRALRKELGVNRAFKNDALDAKIQSYGFDKERTNSRFLQEKDIYNCKKRELRRTKKYNGCIGSMTINSYKELMGE